jgi:sterol desaturase/sphingolipid hydroxylase (fatty acid hydroxylase superfamily)
VPAQGFSQLLTLTGFENDVWNAARDGIIAATVPMPFFFALALIVKRGKFLNGIRRVLSETKVNLSLLLVDQLFTLPILIILSVALADVVARYQLSIVSSAFWNKLPVAVVAIAGVILGDFVAYWRHRFEHSRLIWPSHSIHHSDTALTWMTIFRFHPINRFTTVMIDGAFLLLWGLPPYALVINALVRQYYGAFIHADLPWMFGPLRYVVVIPAAHRWHHAKDYRGSGANFASVFSFFDLIFGTFYVPGSCDMELGISEPIGTGIFSQIAHPLKPSAYPPARTDGLQPSSASRQILAGHK